MKMTHSKLLNIVLVTVLATSLFFISTTASTAEYNPWSDIDGDGDIDIYDVVKVTGIYHTLGDPTRNVVEKAGYYYEQEPTVILPYGETVTYRYATGGYRYITWTIFPVFWHSDLRALSSFSVDLWDYVVDEYFIDESVVAPHRTLQVQGNYFDVSISNVDPEHQSAHISLSVYITA